jgi:hypothetical protein
MRVLGWVATALGIIGLIAGIGLAAGVWVIKPNIDVRIDGLVTAADSGLDRAGDLVDRVEIKMDDLTGRVTGIRSRVDALAAAPLDGPLATSLATAITDFVSGPYAGWRADYSAMRERVMNVGESLTALDNAIPAVQLPGTARERLQEIDATLVDLDAQVMALGQSAATGFSGPGILDRVSERIGQAEAWLATVNQKVTDLGTRLEEARTRLATVQTNVSNVLTLGAGGLSIFWLYFAALNLLLAKRGRAWSKGRKKHPEWQ